MKKAEATLFDEIAEREDAARPRWSCGVEVHPGRPTFGGYFKPHERPQERKDDDE